ncbi:MAG: tetratricopeptide repeat protein [Firmicutes bacterium]|nr:tetratricopeptide repeat protein [Bacillota bacterium]
MAAQEEEAQGWQDIAQGELEAAERHFRRALELDPSRADALNGLGTVYLSWGDLEEAAELFRMAILQAEQDLPRRKRRTGWQDAQVRPYVRGLYHLSLTQIRRGLWDEAIDLLRELIAWDSGGMDGEAHYLLGQMQQRHGRLEEAAAAYTAASAHLDEAWYALGLVRFLEGREREARAAWREALGRLPGVVPFLLYYPRLVPIPAPRIEDTPFLILRRYVIDNADLWTSAARAALEELAREQSE